jgi:hypothetical protein
MAKLVSLANTGTYDKFSEQPGTFVLIMKLPLQ